MLCNCKWLGMADVKKRQSGSVVVDDVRVRLAGSSPVVPISPALLSRGTSSSRNAQIQ